MTIETRPERAKQLRALIGDPREIDRSLREFRKAARVLSSNRPRLSQKQRTVILHATLLRGRFGGGGADPRW